MTKMLSAFAVGGRGIDGITLREIDVPDAGPGQALVRIKAATLNFRDLLIANGSLEGLAKEPEYVPLSCGAGEVVAVGEGVTRVKAGDRVSPIFALGWFSGRRPTMEMLGGTADGTARHFGVFDAKSLVLIPDALSDLEAATIPCAGVTAWNALHQERPVQKGEWVLCPGTGGVSIAAMQFAKAAGAHVIVTSSSDDKLERATALGADVTINYRTTPDWPAAVRRALGGKGVDIVVDVIGASEIETSVSLLNEGGAVAAIGMLASDASWQNIDAGAARLIRITVGNRADHEAALAFAAEQGIHPVIDAVYELPEIAAALRQLERRDFFGKIAMDLS